MISVEEIEPQEAPQEAAPEEAVQLPAPEPEVVDGGAAHSAEPAAEALDIEDAPPEPPKKRGRPKAAPKEKTAPKPKGRPRKVVVPEEPEVPYVPPPPPTDEQLHEYVTPLLRMYASHLMRGREGKRAQYRNLFSRM